MDIKQIEAAAKAGHADHQVYLATLLLMGVGIPRDPIAALRWLDTAAAQGCAAAFRDRAAVKAHGYAGKVIAKGAWADMCKAAELQDAAAQRQVAVQAYLMDRADAGDAFLCAAARQGDIPAQILWADQLYARGHQDAATYWYDVAKEDPLAAWRIKTRDLKVPESVTAPQPAIPSDIWQTLAQHDPFVATGYDLEPVCDNPVVFVKRRAVCPLICQYIMAVGAGEIRPSDVVDAKTGKSKQDPYRTGFHHQFVSGLADFTIALNDHRLAHLTETDIAQGEPLAMIVYRPGEQYKPHWDHLYNNMDEAFSRLERSGNRLWTALLLLDDDHSGGATAFTKLGFDVKLKRGDVLVFRNLTEDGAHDKMTMHAGLPVETGVKWIASKWIRERAYAH